MSAPEEKKKSPWGKRLLVFVLAIFIYNIFADMGKQSSGNQSASSTATTTSAPKPDVNPKDEAMYGLKLDFNWGKGGFDSVMLVDFEFTNKSKYTVKDIKVVCESKANSGTAIDKNQKVIYEIIKPGETKKVQRFNMGFLHSQATSTACGVEDLKVVQ